MIRTKIGFFSFFLSLVCYIFFLYSAAHARATAENISKNPEQIFLYTYHTHPPFLIGDNVGLSYDLASYLTHKAKGQYSFTVKAMSRPRLNKTIAEAKSGVVPWVNPVWFKDMKEEKYLWTKGVFMEDGNDIISHQENKIVYEGPESIKGMLFGGLHGHAYQGIDDYIKDTKQAVRVNAENHIDNFRKLAKRRIDVTVMPSSGAAFYLKQEKFSDKLYISPKPHSRFQRRAIIINNRSDILEYLEGVLDVKNNDQEWRKMIEKYK